MECCTGNATLTATEAAALPAGQVNVHTLAAETRIVQHCLSSGIGSGKTWTPTKAQQCCPYSAITPTLVRSSDCPERPANLR